MKLLCGNASLRHPMSFAALPLPDVLHPDRVRQDGHVPVDVHRGPHPAPHDLGSVLQGPRQPEEVLPQRMA